ncbi:MAG: hypothetical protein K0Q79_2442 [Flavipsychrobacter sp.]|jgi:Mlc titration factor MtfA (ptsG expression regulator)|nr:hypothetical protein [Flavipsychrobacter sp.]
MPGLILLVIAIIAGIVIYYDWKRRFPTYKLPVNFKELLVENVDFYKNLDDNGRIAFELRVEDFLKNTSIKGVDTKVDDLDKILIASGAIMLIFYFPKWRYNNISEIMVYKGTFNRDFMTGVTDANIQGLVGEGVMNRRMLLSRPAIHDAFRKPKDGRNTVVHEFAHLLDKADGTIDGIPEYMLTRPEVLPWVQKVHESIQVMHRGGHTDINYYGATNSAEFFAVVSEYFFEQPDKLKSKHPQLHGMLEEIFRP